MTDSELLSELLARLRWKLERRRALNVDEWRRKPCVTPPPQSIALTFTEADALVAVLARLLGDPEGPPQTEQEKANHG
jgi:hypothetical protein